MDRENLSFHYYYFTINIELILKRLRKVDAPIMIKIFKN